MSNAGAPPLLPLVVLVLDAADAGLEHSPAPKERLAGGCWIARPDPASVRLRPCHRDSPRSACHRQEQEKGTGKGDGFIYADLLAAGSIRPPMLNAPTDDPLDLLNEPGAADQLPARKINPPPFSLVD